MKVQNNLFVYLDEPRLLGHVGRDYPTMQPFKIKTSTKLVAGSKRVCTTIIMCICFNDILTIIVATAVDGFWTLPVD